MAKEQEGYISYLRFRYSGYNGSFEHVDLAWDLGFVIVVPGKDLIVRLMDKCEFAVPEELGYLGINSSVISRHALNFMFNVADYLRPLSKEQQEKDQQWHKWFSDTLFCMREPEYIVSFDLDKTADELCEKMDRKPKIIVNSFRKK
jgi:hypothetical protein